MVTSVTLCASSSRLASSGSRLPPRASALPGEAAGARGGGGAGGARAGTELARCSASAPTRSCRQQLFASDRSQIYRLLYEQSLSAKQNGT